MTRFYWVISILKHSWTYYLLDAYNQEKCDLRELKWMIDVQAKKNSLIQKYYFLYLDFKDHACFLAQRT